MCVNDICLLLTFNTASNVVFYGRFGTTKGPSFRVKQFKNAGKQTELVWSVISSRVDKGANQAAEA
jgi:hypothetical protein